jgi:hypothetical protein
MKIVKPNYYGLKHDEVAKRFEGNPVFVNDFCVKGEYMPSAVYYCAKPNKRKKHKKYMLLTEVDGQFFIRGMSTREMNKYRYQEAVHCLLCDDVVYSINRHDYHSCSCGKVSIDGGRDYTKLAFSDGASFDEVTIDLLTDIISDSNPSYGITKERKGKTKKAEEEKSKKTKNPRPHRSTK